MKYFIDTEFLEGTQDKTIFRIKYGKTKPTIDLISIALVGEDGREYYAISKDFNLKEAWNRYDLKPDIYNGGMKKVYWIRENVLKPIYDDLCTKRSTYEKTYHWELSEPFSYKSMKYLINSYGKTNKQIAKEIKEFVGFPNYYPKNSVMRNMDTTKPEFYGYYADYDWVAFCWLFGKMIDLPKGFPMYCIDLKQEFDKKVTSWRNDRINNETRDINFASWDTYAKALRNHPNYPKQTNEHNALADARWNKQLYEFLNNI